MVRLSTPAAARLMLLCCLAAATTTQAFSTQRSASRAFSPSQRSPLLTPSDRKASATQLHFFWRKKKDESEAKQDGSSKDEVVPASTSSQATPSTPSTLSSSTTTTTEVDGTAEALAASAVATFEAHAEPEPAADIEPAAVEPAAPAARARAKLSPEEEAKRLRADAEKARLEAERMEAELTLGKIAKLEKKLAVAKSKDSKDLDALEREMDILQKRLRGEPITPAPAPAPDASKTEAAATPQGAPISIPTADPYTQYELIMKPDTGKNDSPPMTPQEIKELAASIETSPGFMKQMLARMTKTDYITIADLNTTEVAMRLSDLKKNDLVSLNQDFAKEEIEERKRLFRENPNYKRIYESIKASSSDADDDAIALQTLRMDASFSNFRTGFGGNVSDVSGLGEYLTFGNEVGPMIEVLSTFNSSALDETIDRFYPACTRKEGNSPTMTEIEKFTQDILPKTQFAATSKPEPVLGGFVIRGSSKTEDGSALIDSIDSELEKSSLKDKMTVLYTNDFSIFVDPDVTSDIGFNMDDAKLLYVVGNDIIRERRRTALTLTTILGISTSWYLSIFPFLFNPTLSSKVDEQLALVDAGMTPDLSWLTDLSIPLFVTFIGLQVLHETGHRVAAATKNIELSIPTLVPSLITGVTSAVTTFKTLPRNRNDMFDVSISGPLCGMMGSLFALLVGSQLTMVSDPAIMPALPLDILRQSALGGGIIDAILGNGVLSVPEGAIGTQAIAGMTIPLHPVAVAGFISLLINALALLPIGTTDGGRMAMAMFGRPGKLGIGLLFLLIALFAGIKGSDLFLFYFSFIVAFQSGNEIPARDEVTQVEFSRILVATGAYVVAVLALIPM